MSGSLNLPLPRSNLSDEYVAHPLTPVGNAYQMEPFEEDYMEYSPAGYPLHYLLTVLIFSIILGILGVTILILVHRELEAEARARIAGYALTNASFTG